MTDSPAINDALKALSIPGTKLQTRKASFRALLSAVTSNASSELQLQLLHQLTEVLQYNPTASYNCGTGIITILLRHLQQVITTSHNDTSALPLAEQLLTLISIIGRYSIQVKHVHTLLSILRDAKRQPDNDLLQSIAGPIIQCLSHVAAASSAATQTPNAMFQVQQAGAGSDVQPPLNSASNKYLRLNAIERWSNRGYSLCMWLCHNPITTSSSHATATAAAATPTEQQNSNHTVASPLKAVSGSQYLYSFVTSRAKGVEAYLNVSGYLCLRNLSSSGSDLVTTVKLPTSTWCMLTITHVKPARFSRSNGTISLCINGMPVYESEFQYPSITDPLQFCALGGRQITGATAAPSSFNGLIGCCSLFNKALTQSEIASLYRAGYDFPLYLQNGSTGEWLKSLVSTGLTKLYSVVTSAVSITPIGLLAGVQQQKQLPMTVKDAIAGKHDALYDVLHNLQICYHPLATKPPTNSDNGDNLSAVLDLTSSFARRHIAIDALFSDDIQTVQLTDVQDSIHCTVAGLNALLPVLTLPSPSTHSALTKSESTTHSTIALVFRFLAQTLLHHSASQREAVRDNTFELIGYLLTSAPPQLSLHVVDALQQLLYVITVDLQAVDVAATSGKQSRHRLTAVAGSVSALNDVVRHVLANYAVWYRPGISYETKLAVVNLLHRITQQHTVHMQQLHLVPFLIDTLSTYCSYDAVLRAPNSASASVVMALNDLHTLRQPCVQSIQLLLSTDAVSSNMNLLLSIASESVDSCHVADIVDVIAYQMLQQPSASQVLLELGGPLTLLSVLHRHADHVHVQVACIDAIGVWLKTFRRPVPSEVKEVAELQQHTDALFHQLHQILSERALYDATYHALLRLMTSDYSVGHKEPSVAYTIHLLKLHSLDSIGDCEPISSSVTDLRVHYPQAITLILSLLTRRTADATSPSLSSRRYTGEHNNNGILSRLCPPTVSAQSVLSDLDAMTSIMHTNALAALYTNPEVLHVLCSLLLHRYTQQVPQHPQTSPATPHKRTFSSPAHARQDSVMSDTTSTQVQLACKIITTLVISSMREQPDVGSLPLQRILTFVRQDVDNHQHELRHGMLEFAEEELWVSLLQRLSQLETQISVTEPIRRQTLQRNFAGMVDLLENTLYLEPRSVNLAYKVMRLDHIESELLEDDETAVTDEQLQQEQQTLRHGPGSGNNWLIYGDTTPRHSNSADAEIDHPTSPTGAVEAAMHPHHTLIVDELARCCIRLQMNLLPATTKSNQQNMKNATDEQKQQLSEVAALRTDSPLRVVLRAVIHVLIDHSHQTQVPTDAEDEMDVAALQDSLFNLVAICHTNLSAEYNTVQTNRLRNSYLLWTMNSLLQLAQTSLPPVQRVLLGALRQMTVDLKPMALVTPRFQEIRGVFAKPKQLTIAIAIDEDKYTWMVDSDDSRVHAGVPPSDVHQYVEGIANELNTLQHQLASQYLVYRETASSNLRHLLRRTAEDRFTRSAELQNTASRATSKLAATEVRRRNASTAERKAKQQTVEQRWTALHQHVLLGDASPWQEPEMVTRQRYWQIDDHADSHYLRRKLVEASETDDHAEASQLYKASSSMTASRLAQQASAAAAATPASPTEIAMSDVQRQLRALGSVPASTDIVAEEDDIDQALFFESDDEEQPKQTNDAIAQLKAAPSIAAPVADPAAQAAALEPGADVTGQQQTSPLPAGSESWEYITDAPNIAALAEDILSFSNSTMVFAIGTIAGTLRLTKQELIFTPDDTENGALLNELNGGSNDLHKSQVDTYRLPSLNRIRQKQHRTYTWPLSTLIACYRRRYQLQRTAVEISTTDRKAHLIDVVSQDNRTELLRQLLQLKPPKLNRLLSSAPIDIINRTRLTERWQRRELSNFEYLVMVNHISGRTYNDLNQYPVMPWILQHSAEVDSNKEVNMESIIAESLTHPLAGKVFRDLSKPIGAINPDRLEQILERYRSFSDDTILPFMYGSHYSNAAVVLFYLMRLEPYTSLHIELQAGKFDVADRLFSSISETWSSCIESLSNYKELVPELFYMPEVLQNINQYNLGRKQDGVTVGDVELPSWAADAAQYVRLNRLALESEYVSQHLHQWIDLIWGSSQRGQAAADANNLFFYLSYEGGVDLTTIDDPLLREAAKQQIAQFGQCPTQLWTKPHPKRHSLDAMSLAKLSLRELSGVDYEHDYLKRATITEAIPLICISVHPKQQRIYTIAANMSVSMHMWLPDEPTEADRDEHSGSDNHAQQTPNKQRRFRLPFTILTIATLDLFKPIHAGRSGIASLADGRLCIEAGGWDRSVHVLQMSGRIDREQVNAGEAALFGEVGCELTQQLVEHRKTVHLLAVDQNDSSAFVSASHDCTCVVWDVVTTSASAFGVALPFGESRSVSPIPRHVLRGHLSAINSAAINNDLDVAVSTSTDGTVLMHSTRTGYVLHSFKLNDYVQADTKSPTAASLVRVSPHTLLTKSGDIVFYSHELEADRHPLHLQLSVCNINVRYWRSVAVDDEVTAMSCSLDGQLLACGSTGGTVLLRRTSDLQVVQRFERAGSAISTITFSPHTDYIFIGTQTGQMLVYAIKC